MEKISIIVPVYKIEELFLRRCIESLLYQTLSGITIILIDDGSPDNSGKICDEYSNYSNVKVIHQENKGVSVARNVGIEASNSEYIMFVDGDDYLLKDTCQKVYDAAISNDYDITLFKFSRTDKKNVDSCITYDVSFATKQYVKAIILQNEPYKGYSICTPWGKLFKSSFIKKNKLEFDSHLRKSQDKVFNLYSFEKDPKVGRIDFTGYVYVFNNDSICNRYNGRITAYYENLVCALEEFIDKYYKDDDEIITAYKSTKILFLYEICLVDFFNKNNPKPYKRRIKDFTKYLSTNNYSFKKINKGSLKKHLKIFEWLLSKKLYRLLQLFYNLIGLYKKIKILI